MILHCNAHSSRPCTMSTPILVQCQMVARDLPTSLAKHATYRKDFLAMLRGQLRHAGHQRPKQTSVANTMSSPSMTTSSSSTDRTPTLLINCMVKMGNDIIPQIKVGRSEVPAKHATWEDYYVLRSHSLTAAMWEEAQSQGQRSVASPSLAGSRVLADDQQGVGDTTHQERQVVPGAPTSVPCMSIRWYSDDHPMRK